MVMASVMDHLHLLYLLVSALQDLMPSQTMQQHGWIPMVMVILTNLSME